MLIIFLLFVEEDTFSPILPKPEIKPKIDWFREIEQIWVNMGIDRDLDYYIGNFKYRDLIFEIQKERDFAPHYSIEAFIKTLSFTFKSNYIEWNKIRSSKTNGWKWFGDDRSFLLLWLENMSFQDSTSTDGGFRFYQVTGPFYLGGWVSYRERIDYGVSLQFGFLRGELGKETMCINFVTEYGEIKGGKFRERFPMVYFPLEGFLTHVKSFYGVEINMLDLKIIGGRKYSYVDSYIEEEKTLKWKEGESYFANIEFNREDLGIKCFYQNKGYFTGFGELYATTNLWLLGSQFSLTGYLTPKKYIRGGISLWLRAKFSPFISIKNLSWAKEVPFQDPICYIGIRYVNHL
ncbi:MAG: hypothetical protein ABIN61_02215 [candidate division WOR-3 bacterium]